MMARAKRDKLTREALLEEHRRKRDEIERRLEEFAAVWRRGDEREIFEELVFCILAAGASARLGLKCIEALRPILMAGDADEIFNAIKGLHLYPESRARYIIETREYLRRELDMRLKEKIAPLGHQERRAYLAENPQIRGIGYKEASHFLRNIGLRGYAILDKHVVRSLHELGVLESDKPPSTKRQYLEAERAMKEFAREAKIDLDVLDLLLWSHKTGVILK